MISISVNSSPTGQLTIVGTPKQGQTLSLQSTVSDADGMGTWSYQWLRDGVAIDGATGDAYQLVAGDVDHAISAVISYVDGAGKPESVGADPVPVQGALAAPTLNPLNAAYDTGASNSDGITRNAAPTINGRGAAGSQLHVLDGDTVLGTVTVASNGSWSFKLPVLASGSHALHAQAFDASGNISSSSALLALTVDTTAPAKPVLALDLAGSPVASGTATQATNVGVGGTTEAGARVDLLEGTAVVGTTIADTDGNFHFTQSGLSEGSHAFVARATDLAGNMVSSMSAKIVVDLTGPAAPAITGLTAMTDTGVSATDHLTRSTQPVLTGTAEAGSTVNVYEQFGDATALVGSAVASSLGNWTLKPALPLGEGEHQLVAQAVDRAGNTGGTSGAFALTIDTTGPAKPTLLVSSDGNSLASGAATQATHVAIAGATDPNATLELRDGTTLLQTAQAGVDGSYGFDVSGLTEGAHKFTVKAIDAAGNATSSITSSVTVDLTAPDAPTITGLVASTDTGISNSDGITRNVTPSLTGTAVAGATVSIYDADSALVGTTKASSLGNWTFKLPTQVDGVHGFTAKQADVAGNVSEASVAYDVTVATSALPYSAIEYVLNDHVGYDSGMFILGAGGEVHMSGQLMSGGEALFVYDNGKLLGNALVDAGGSWTFTIVGDGMTEGRHSMTYKQVDLAGNLSSAGYLAYNYPGYMQVDRTPTQVHVTSLSGGAWGITADPGGRAWVQDASGSPWTAWYYLDDHGKLYDSNAPFGYDYHMPGNVTDLYAAAVDLGQNMTTQRVIDGTSFVDQNTLFDPSSPGSNGFRMLEPYGYQALGPISNTSVFGSDYDDQIALQGGENWVDGGKNIPYWAQAGRPQGDEVWTFANSAEEAAAVTITKLAGSGSVADKLAYSTGYRIKVVNGTEVDYLKNVETLHIAQGYDYDGEGHIDGYINSWRTEALGMASSTTYAHPADPSMAWYAEGSMQQQRYLSATGGTNGSDSFNAATTLDTTTRDLMTTWHRGALVDLGAGNDTAVGSAYGDIFVMGSGTNYVKGGSDLGTTGSGADAKDVLEVYVDSQYDPLQITQLSASSSGSDLTAFNQGYTFKVVAGSETDYLAGVERVDFYTNWNDTAYQGDFAIHDSWEATGFAYADLTAGVQIVGQPPVAANT